jgi:hypothetical protein
MPHNHRQVEVFLWVLGRVGKRLANQKGLVSMALISKDLGQGLGYVSVGK